MFHFHFVLERQIIGSIGHMARHWVCFCFVLFCNGRMIRIPPLPDAINQSRAPSLPRLVAGQIVGTFDLCEQRRLIIYVHSGYWPKNSRFSLLSSVRPWITMTLEYWLWWFRPLTPLQCYQERSSEYWNWRLEKFRWTFQIWRSFSTSGAKGKTYWKI